MPELNNAPQAEIINTDGHENDATQQAAALGAAQTGEFVPPTEDLPAALNPVIFEDLNPGSTVALSYAEADGINNAFKAMFDELQDLKSKQGVTGSKIKGYSTLSAEQVDNMNKLKQKEAEIGQLWIELESNPDADKRWLAIGKTEIQNAFMSLNRAIAKPVDFFAKPTE